MVRLFLALLLICACAAVSAREVRLQTPNGETGTCPEVEAAPAATATAKAAPAAAPARGAKPANKPANAATTQGGGGDATVRSQGPRWHSFLPGMFR